MDFIELKISCLEGYVDILIAELGFLGYDSMEETEDGLSAYIEEDRFNEKELNGLIERYKSQTDLKFSRKKVKRENWNAEWESNYSPIIIEDKCVVQASFHDVEGDFDYKIIVNPKMSFGTGHHETTYQMLGHQMEIDHYGKRVMDAGCGTGILAIMAEKRGASLVDAFDIDPWCVENGKENIELNQAENINIHLGDITQMDFGASYDIVLANINKNVLLQEMKIYASYLDKDGLLLLSGFYKDDVEDILEEAGKHNMVLIKESERNKWASIVLRKAGA